VVWLKKPTSIVRENLEKINYQNDGVQRVVKRKHKSPNTLKIVLSHKRELIDKKKKKFISKFSKLCGTPM
jgi:hypothetical protein